MKTISYLKNSIVTILLCFCTVLQAQNVIVVVMDGARYTETFGAGNTYIPHLYDDMKPLGTLFTNFQIDYPNGYTQTCPGHSALETGTWQPIANDGSERPTKPTIFEYLRKEDGNPQSDCYVVTGKDKLDMLTYSTYSGYGSSYGGTWIGDDSRDDALSYSKVISVMQNYQPKILVINFAEVDDVGHTGNWNNYLSAITNADNYIYQLWQHIENGDWGYNPQNTTLFITNDHGRHDDAHGGFQNHGDGCEGCKHIMLLALGREITANQTVDSATWQTDIAPTVGDLLDFETPYATGISLSTTFQLTFILYDGWNMVSVPGLHPVNQDPITWWPSKDPGASVFKYTGGYIAITATAPTEGYWMKHVGPMTYNIPGIQIVTHNDISAASGWNMIGGYENIVPVGGLFTTPPGLITGTIFEYSGGYVPATNITPGYGYWVNMSAAGLIGGLSEPPMGKVSNPVAEYFKEDWGKIIITDNAGISYTLYAVKGEVNLDNYELPPSPPADMFDIRYGSGRIAEDLNSSVQSILMSGIEYPVRVRVENMSITLQDESGTKINAELKPGEELAINDNSINKLRVLSDEIGAPVEYALEQNYPNPFNSLTKIVYLINQNSYVKLVAYNLLGEQIVTLVNSEKVVGRHEIFFDASSLPSGVYFYQLTLENLIETKKMIVLK